MKKILSFCTLSAAFLLASCARDLSSDVYTSSSTLSLTLTGEVISVREVTIQANDTLGANEAGIIGGGLGGAALGSAVSNRSNQGSGIIAGAVIGGAVGAIGQKMLSKSKGYEYIVKVDTSKLKDNYYEGSKSMRAAISSATTSGLVTIVQGKDKLLPVGSKVYVIFSDNRTRIIPVN